MVLLQRGLRRLRRGVRAVQGAESGTWGAELRRANRGDPRSLRPPEASPTMRWPRRSTSFKTDTQASLFTRCCATAASRQGSATRHRHRLPSSSPRSPGSSLSPVAWALRLLAPSAPLPRAPSPGSCVLITLGRLPNRRRAGWGVDMDAAGAPPLPSIPCAFLATGGLDSGRFRWRGRLSELETLLWSNFPGGFVGVGQTRIHGRASPSSLHVDAASANVIFGLDAHRRFATAKRYTGRIAMNVLVFGVGDTARKNSRHRPEHATVANGKPNRDFRP